MISEHILKLTGSHPLSGPLDASQYARIATEIQIYEVAKRDKGDGTFDLVYKAKAVAAVDAEQNGKVIKGIENKRWSKKLRGQIYILGQELGVSDDEVFYNEVMAKILNQFPEVYCLITSKI